MLYLEILISILILRSESLRCSKYRTQYPCFRSHEAETCKTPNPILCKAAASLRCGIKFCKAQSHQVGGYQYLVSVCPPGSTIFTT